MTIDCKTCEYAGVMFGRAKEDRHSATYAPEGWVRCLGPRYKGRYYLVRDKRKACLDYKRKTRPAQ